MENEIPLHYVCTRDEARAILYAAEGFWISDCGCREGREDGQSERTPVRSAVSS